MKKKRIWLPVFLVLCIAAACYCIFVGYLNMSIQPVNEYDSELISVELSSNNVRTAGKELEEQGLIKSGVAFSLRAQLSGTAGEINSGTYYLSRDMDADKIISILSKGNHDQTQSVTLTIPEGATVEDIADELYEANVIYDKEAFLEQCDNVEYYSDNENYPYIEYSEGEKYILEGFLFPDTYEFLYNLKPEEVIDMMLSRFYELYSDEYAQKAESLGYTTKQIVTIASIIEKEATADDFSKVSAVIYNRLDNGMNLQCDSTIRYLTNIENTISLNEEQYEYDSPYNSYKNKGLIPGPICNPSIAAIDAALNPDSQYIDDEYMYFCSTDAFGGSLVFSKTYNEHLENVKKYKSSWEAYDNTVRNN